MRHVASLLLIFFLIAGCGGGGGGGADGGDGTGGGTAGRITYTGETTQSRLTANNANRLFALIWDGGSSSQLNSTGPKAVASTPSVHATNAGFATVAASLVKQVSSTASRFSGAHRRVNSSIPVNETTTGTVSGTFSMTGSIDDGTGKGSLVLTYINFNDGSGYIYDGSLTMQVAGYDLSADVITDATLTCTVLTTKSAAADLSISGAIRFQLNLQTATEVTTINVDGRDNVANKSFRFENFVLTDLYDNQGTPTTLSERYSGRLYLETMGYVEVTTTSPCLYSDLQAHPSSGGPVVLTGAGNSSARVTPLSTSYVQIEVDADGDRTFESKKAHAWNNLAGAPVDVPPLANAGPDQTVETGATVTLTASGSSDLLDYPLTCSWTLTSKPSGSQATLTDSTAMIPSFFVDLPGDYRVSLTVSNGTTSSNADEAVVSASGPPNSGFFKTYVGYTVGSKPQGAAIGDVNGDGRNDVVLSTASSNDPANDNHVFVFLQNSAGGLDQPVKYPAGNGNSVAIGDMNGDGGLDVIVTASNGIDVLYQNSSRTLNRAVFYASNHQSFSNAYRLKTGDFNHDGRMDVVTIDWGTQSIDADIFYQNAGGTFNAPVRYAVSHGGWDDLAVGDVNNDGFSDIVVMSGQGFGSNIGTLTQKSDGTFNAAVYYSIGSNNLTSGVGVGDVNGDSLQDIVVAYGGNAGRIGVFRQNSTGTLDAATSYSSYDSPQAVEIGDVNNDGRQDILVAHGGWYRLGVYLQGTSGELLAEERYPIPYGPNDLVVGDVNGDGLKDVVIADYNEGLIVLYHK